MLIEYKRKGNPRKKNGTLGNANARTRKGIMVAFPDEEKGVINFGFSLCCFRQNKEDVDEFDVDFGTKLAIERALSVDRPLCIPCSMTKQFERFVDKCVRYYKQIQHNENLGNKNREIIYTPQEVSDPSYAMSV